MLGYYNPRTKPETLTVKRDRLEHWLKAGAQPSDTVRTLANEVVTGLLAATLAR